MASTAVARRALNLASRPLIAPLWHTILMVVFLAVPLLSGIIVQSRPTPNGQIFSSHSQAMLRFYIPVLILEWLLVLFVWLGVRKRSYSLRFLVAGHWDNWRKLALDMGLGMAAWVTMLVIGALLARVLGPGHAKATSVILPQTKFEMLLWVAIAATAGFVEELVYRGYLQTQFVRLGLSPLLAMGAQALVFGAGHAYEGRNAVTVITVYALLFGALAFWRRSLRPGIIGHAWFDIAVVFLIRR